MRHVALAIVIAACSGTSPKDAAGPGDTAAALTKPSSSLQDTAFRIEDMGQLMLVEQLDNGVLQRHLYGLFVDFHEDYRNLSRCAVDHTTCFNVTPSEVDTYVDLPARNYFPTDREFRYVGLDVGLGPFTADYYYEDLGGSGHYYRDVSDIDRPTEPLGARFGVEWGRYDGENDLVLLDTIDVVTPRPDQSLKFANGDTVLFEWTPTGEGEIFLQISAFNYERLYWLTDDGYFELDVDSLGWGDADKAFDISLGRWNSAQTRSDNNQLDLLDVTEVVWSGRYFWKNLRQEIEPADSCLEAQGVAPITQTGSWWGRLGGFRPDLDPGLGNACTLFQAPGAEGLIPLELEPFEIATIDYTLKNGDGSVYLVTDCSDARTCVAGADGSLLGDLESFQYFNNTDEVQRLYIVLDGYENEGGGIALGTFDLTVSIDQLVEPEMHDTCPDAQMQLDPIGSGTYYTEFLPYTNVLNPGAGGCTGSSLPGPESMSKVTLEPGQTVSAAVTMPGADPGIYLLYNCTNVFSCPIGADNRGDAVEALAYTNGNAVSETLYLVVDSKTRMSPYFLTVDIF